ncbi:MAG: hypothetical protein AVDCRST_MAG07-663 [uncultured Frankineae bacterium]|uniref:DICT domain-containing protein n=1 Tax=uncultured Frankineae bacterium TaxID=437475 RepID=A0A6J4KRB3_9ACTN|nr:MAG: hypothetical protein AVDCRST_MAG07-663 [uncultured Frankineae bacterium]
MDSPTPYAVVSRAERPQLATKAEVLALCRRLERGALVERPDAVAASLQDARYLSERTRELYGRLAAVGVPVTVHARGLHAWIAPGVRGVDVDDDDPVGDEWVLVLASSRAPVVLAATDLRRPAAADLDRSFLCAVSRDPEVVAGCLRLLGPAAGGLHSVQRSSAAAG